jgi:hypothetical protein
MTNVVMNMDGCDLAHETLMLKEFGDAVNYAGPEQLHVKHVRTGSKHLKGVASAPEEVIDSVKSILSSAFPKCP